MPLILLFVYEDHALEIHEIRDAVIPGAISMAMDMGKSWREARAKGEDAADAIAAKGAGFVAFRRMIGASDWKTEDGFTIGNVSIDGLGDFEGDTYRIWLKNENMVGWLNDKVHATIPDMICLIDIDTGEPVTNLNYFEGQNVAVVILPAPKPFTTAKGLAAFGPSYIGLDQPYRPAVLTVQ